MRESGSRCSAEGLRPSGAGTTAAAAAAVPGRRSAAAETSSSAAPAPPPPTSVADPFDAAKKSVVTVLAKLAFEKGFATGTGFFVTPSGKLVTNFHVVKRTDYQQILMPGRKKPIDAHILATDEEHDLALLQAMVEPPVPVAPPLAGRCSRWATRSSRWARRPGPSSR